jgi:hypothetical protein
MIICLLLLFWGITVDQQGKELKASKMYCFQNIQWI